MWWLIPVVGGGALVVYLLARGMKPETPAVYAPPPGAPALMSGGSRYLTYIQRIDSALLAYRAAKAIGGTAVTEAAKNLSAVIDVVKMMASQDVAAKRITVDDMNNINAKIDAAKKELG